MFKKILNWASRLLEDDFEETLRILENQGFVHLEIDDLQNEEVIEIPDGYIVGNYFYDEFVLEEADLIAEELFAEWADEDHYWSNPDRLHYNPKEGF